MQKELIEKTLQNVKYPGFSRDIVSFGLIRNIEIAEDGTVGVHLAVTTADPQVPEKLKQDIQTALASLEGITDVQVKIAVTQPKAPPSSSPNNTGGSNKPDALQKVRYCVAVASGKGGVGKSTLAVNLACALEKELSKEGKSSAVGLMDCDIYGPSTPLVMGINERPGLDGDYILPLENFGVQVMSMGFLIDEDAPVVWRGPMVMKTIQQFAMNVKWGDLEILVIDLPPGTGDAQLSLVQTIPLDGAIIITTPQPAASNVALRGARMFEKVNVPILGVVENMSYYEDPATGEKNHIFGKDGGKLAAKYLETECLAEIPLDSNLRVGSDRGIPMVVSDPESHTSQIFCNIAKEVLESLRKKKEAKQPATA